MAMVSATRNVYRLHKQYIFIRRHRCDVIAQHYYDKRCIQHIKYRYNVYTIYIEAKPYKSWVYELGSLYTFRLAFDL